VINIKPGSSKQAQRDIRQLTRLHLRVPHDVNLRVVQDSSGHRFRGAKFTPPVDHRHLAGGEGEETQAHVNKRRTGTNSAKQGQPSAGESIDVMTEETRLANSKCEEDYEEEETSMRKYGECECKEQECQTTSISSTRIFITEIKQRYLGCHSGQKQRLLHGGVAPANHRGVLALVEETVAGGARVHASAQESLLSRHPQPFRSCARGYYHLNRREKGSEGETFENTPN
jgi:hypothetical protein